MSTSDPDEGSMGRVSVALWVYGEDQREMCFSEGFLDAAAREGQVNVHRRLVTVHLEDDAIFDYPLAVMAGQGPFELPEAQKRQLHAYLTRGGTVLASASCSSGPWAAHFEALVQQLFPDTPMQPLSLDHPVFHTLYEIDRITTRKETLSPPALTALMLDHRLAVVFAPDGLNDSSNAGGGCCCCGGNEIRNARAINANIVTYVLTH